MGKGKFRVIAFGSLFLLLATLLIYTQASGTGKEVNNNGSQLSKKEQKELDDFIELFGNDGGFLSQAGKEIKNAGYSHSIAAMVYSKDDIWLKIVLPDSEVITEQKQSKIKSILNGIIMKNKFNPKAFKVEIGYGDKPPS
ncbi:hypothetical protein FITA111629_06685 [Filibacter tadaridae]|uniref:Uncharacterized protein n=1 Tax=Filibacter tadaridae TaxID=2483811 RepID=A0A3P5WTW5_9BACL|nr:hypothetical protein [Filibacter tadaridae]VDC26816.1 hypothetical protein FILTAD_01519 [Filibacter tadaridae]